MEIRSMNELVNQCKKEKKRIWELIVMREIEKSGIDRHKIMGMMEDRLMKMKEAIDNGLKDGSSAPSGISGGDAIKMQEYVNQGKALTGHYARDAMIFSLATSESNARMGVIVATPTAGAAGILPGVLFALQKNDCLSNKELVRGLFTASALGYVIANRSFISGAAGGCQAEIGSATAMAAGAIVELKGGSPEQAVNATALAMKSLLGLICDPVAGLVEVPCIKRNVIGTSIAFSAADLSLAGIESRIPCDEVIETMYKVGKNMPRVYKETSLGGLAETETGKRVKEQLYQK